MPLANARLAVILLVTVPMPLLAQSSQAPSVSLPRLISISGTLRPADGQPPAAIETVTLAIYAEETGGTTLWQETQGVAVDAEGRYTLLLGATQRDGIPLDVFASGEAHWLGVTFERPGEVEAPRIRITSVPYALRAADAGTLGGKPASAYVLAHTESSGATRTGGANAEDTVADPSSVQPGTTNALAKYVSETDIGPSSVVELAGSVGIGTGSVAPYDQLHIRFFEPNGARTGLAVQNTSNSLNASSGLLFYDQNSALAQFQGFNNTSHEYRINNIARNGVGVYNGSINIMTANTSRLFLDTVGNIGIGTTAPNAKLDVSGGVSIDGALNLPFTTNPNTGVLKIAGMPFLHRFGENTMLGANSGNFTTTGFGNAGFGTFTFAHNTSGFLNTAAGDAALYYNTSGFYNTAIGVYASLGNITGNSNSALGVNALLSNETGSLNVAVGASSLMLNPYGSNNIAIGANAGSNVTTGDNNIYIGHPGATAEASVIRIGNSGAQSRAFIAGVSGVTTGGEALPVVVDANGQLGTAGALGSGRLACTTVVQNFTNTTDLSCPANHIAVSATCGSVPVINGQNPPPPSVQWGNYLTPNVDNATGVHCEIGALVSAQANVRCCR